jgi:hypothetical protein
MVAHDGRSPPGRQCHCACPRFRVVRSCGLVSEKGEETGTKPFEREPNLYFDPNEICVVFEPEDSDNPADTYDHVANVLNRWLQGSAATFFEEFRFSPFERLIAPSQEMLPGLLRRRSNVSPPESKEAPPFTPLPQPEYGKRTERRPMVLGVYQVRAERLTFAPDARDPQYLEYWQSVEGEASATLGLVNLLYLALRKGAIEGPIIAVTPNWLCSASHISPSPGSKPEPIPWTEQSVRGWTFQFPNLVLDAAVRCAKDRPQGEVMVAILDTRPSPDEIDKARGKNRLLDSLVHSTPLLLSDDIPPSFSQDHFKRLGEISPNRGGPTYEKQQFRDHGLFIAGIIHDIAPRAELRLVRTIGGYGVSALQDLAEGLRRVSEIFNEKQEAAKEEQRPAPRLIVNLSLGLTIPPGSDLIDEWLIGAIEQLGGEPEAVQHLADVMETIAARPAHEISFEQRLAGLINSPRGSTVAGIDLRELQDYLINVRQSAAEIFAWIEAHPEVLVIAAAGNDRRPHQIPEPRYPASDEQVMGVAAINRRIPPHPTNYTNRGDTGIIDDGVAIWGGDAVPAGDGYSLANITLLGPDRTDAIKGIYSAEEVLGVANDSGWVYWSGTSFATPIVTGIAAALWAGAPGATAQTIKAAIRQQATQPANSLAVSAIIARQVPIV